MDARIAEPLKRRPIVSTHTCLSEHHLIVARLGMIGLATLTVATLLLMLPAYLCYLFTVCVKAVCPVGQLTPQTVQMLLAVGLSVNTFVVSTLLLTLISLLMCWGVAAVIVWRKSDDWMALLVAIMLVLMGTAYVTHLVQQQPSPWQVPALFLNILAFDVLFLVFALFPNGRFVPSWIGWLPVGWIAWGLMMLFFLNDLSELYHLYLVGYLCALTCIVGAQWYRYRHVSTGVQRQQTKWVVWGSSVAMIGVMAVFLPEVLFPSLVQQSWLYRLLDAPSLTLALFLGSFSIGMALLRSRLWDVDVLINRTLVYSVLSVLLVLMHVGLVIALQFLLRGFLGQTNDIELVASTLAIVAIFHPLRRGVQSGIDRRFYRRKYDAARTLAAFSARLRSCDDIDLNILTADLLNVVEETMQPTHVSLWLLSAERRMAQTTLPLTYLAPENPSTH